MFDRKKKCAVKKGTKSSFSTKKKIAFFQKAKNKLRDAKKVGKRSFFRTMQIYYFTVFFPLNKKNCANLYLPPHLPSIPRYV